jgi:hypothetical protein
MTASLGSESTGICRLEPLLLLFAGSDGPDAASEVPIISSKLNYNCYRDLHPPAPSGKMLSQPQADTIIGWLPLHNQALATEPLLATAFSVDNEEAVADFNLNPILMFPFLSLLSKPTLGESYPRAPPHPALSWGWAGWLSVRGL